jgi:hypothetical protein
VKKVLKFGAIALLVFFIAYRPEPASRAALRIGGMVGSFADGVGQFVANLFR